MNPDAGKLMATCGGLPPLSNPAEAALVERHKQRTADLIAYARVLARKGCEPEAGFNPEQGAAYDGEVRVLLIECLETTLASVKNGRPDVTEGLNQAARLGRLLAGKD